MPFYENNFGAQKKSMNATLDSDTAYIALL